MNQKLSRTQSKSVFNQAKLDSFQNDIKNNVYNEMLDVKEESRTEG